MIRLALCLVLLAGAVSAAALDQSKRPVARGQIAAEPAAPTAYLAAFRPMARPAPVAAVLRPEPAIEANPPAGAAVISAQAASFSLRPSLRPRAVEEKAMAKRRAQRRGSVCGDLDIQGEEVGFVPGRIKGCGIQNAVRITSVSGIGLTQAATIDCPTAKALNTWVKKSAVPAFRSTGGGLQKLRVAAHYACRTRNNQPGARISEHGRGRAIDVSGFQMRDGQMITVLKGWNARASSKALRRVHKGACGPFGTVLGPNSDRFHRDHFHFDTARYRSGPYCK